jgi:uncharacterized membrane protein
MRRSRALHLLLCAILVVSVLIISGGGGLVFAAQDNSSSNSSSVTQPPLAPDGTLELVSRYPTFEGNSGDSFDFEVGLKWTGTEPRTFDLSLLDVPPLWKGTIVAGYPTEKTIYSIALDPEMTYSETITVRLAPLSGELPDPGNYAVTLEATSGDIQQSVQLTAVVTSLYRLAFYTPSGRIDTEVTAGQDNHLTLEVGNTGTAPFGTISFTSSKPSGWDITFSPDKIDSLAPGIAKQVDAIITPPSKTISGDYMVTLLAISEQNLVAPRSLDIRVTALTPTIWGWVGVIIVLVVIGGLGVIFRRLGRR